MLINGGQINGAAINGLFNANISTFTFVDKKDISSILFTVIITGANDSLPDVTVPISSISGTLNINGTDNLLIVCPDGVTYGSDISLRPNGGFIITSIETYTDGTSASVVSPEYSFTGITTDQGSSSFSVSMRGSATSENLDAKRYLSNGVSSLSINSSAKSRATAPYNADLKTGDKLTLDDSSDIICGTITYTINTKGMFMTVTEQ